MAYNGGDFQRLVRRRSTVGRASVSEEEEEAMQRLGVDTIDGMCRVMEVAPGICQQTDPDVIIKQSILFGWAANSTGSCQVSPVLRRQQSKEECAHKFEAIQSIIERLHGGEVIGGEALESGGFGAPQIVPLHMHTRTTSSSSSSSGSSEDENGGDSIVVKYIHQERAFRKAVAGLQLISDRRLWDDRDFSWHFINVYDYFPRRVLRNPSAPQQSVVQYLVVMEKMDGSGIDFVRRFRRDPNMMRTSLQRMALQLLTGLRVLNKAGLAHTDIKPGNVTYLLNGEGKAFFKFIDLDCITDAQSFNGCRTSFYMDVHQPDETNAFRQGQITSERLDKSEEARVRLALITADLYKFGLTLLEMGLGYHPFGGGAIGGGGEDAAAAGYEGNNSSDAPTELCPSDNMCMGEMQFIMKLARPKTQKELLNILAASVARLRARGTYSEAFVDLVKHLVTQPPHTRLRGLAPILQELERQQQ